MGSSSDNEGRETSWTALGARRRRSYSGERGWQWQCSKKLPSSWVFGVTHVPRLLRPYFLEKKFLDFLEASLEKWGVEHWSATVERSTSGKLHTHLVLQFRTAVDRTARYFAFKSRAPNASVNDLLNEGLCRKKIQQPVDRSFFYVWADKEGTERNESGQPCVAGNY